MRQGYSYRKLVIGASVVAMIAAMPLHAQEATSTTGRAASAAPPASTAASGVASTVQASGASAGTDIAQASGASAGTDSAQASGASAGTDIAQASGASAGTDIAQASGASAGTDIAQASGASAGTDSAQANSSGAAGARSAGIDEIVVTAQKRAQSINEVGMSITAVSADTLVQRGLTDPSDLVKAVPGFVYQETAVGNPVYTLRGVGFIDQTLAASPTVSVYVDEVPLPFAFMTRAAALDLERLEVLKGPQGILYGMNSTGGAFNYIAAKPTDSFAAGADVSYGRFNTLDAQGFLSGPVAPTLNARLALRTIQSNDWQESYTRHDTVGGANQTQGRLLLDWEPVDRLSVEFNLNGWIDKSETQQPQIVAVTPQVPATVKPFVANYPITPRRPRAADWTPGLDYGRDDWFWQTSARANYDVTDDVALTSITAFQKFKTEARYDNDGMTFRTGDRLGTGQIRAFYQELRLTGETERLNWIIGANYSHAKTRQLFTYFLSDASNATVGPVSFTRAAGFDRQTIESYAGFGNLEFRLTDQLTVNGGLRYTETNRDSFGCGLIVEQALVDLNLLVQSVFKPNGPITPVGIGDCFTLNENFDPAPSLGRLRENNLSWRAGLDWKPGDDTLLYANVSKGYKAGSIPNFSAASYLSLIPVPEESILAYEAGFKTSLLDRMAQVNGAVFYYDYKKKQLFGLLTDQIFGVIQQLVSIPESEVTGAELELVLQPAEGLNLSVSGVYLDTNIIEFTGVNAAGQLADFAGTRFPYAPKWQIVGDGQYSWPVSGELSAFVGAGFTYHSRTSAAFGNEPLFAIDPYTIIDLRAGVEHPDGRWRAQIWGRNITNEYYWTTVERQQDSTLRYAGKPLTYGVTLSFRFE